MTPVDPKEALERLTKALRRRPRGAPGYDDQVLSIEHQAAEEIERLSGKASAYGYMLAEAADHLRAIVARLRQDGEWPLLYDGHAQDLGAAFNWLGEHGRDIEAAMTVKTSELPTKLRDESTGFGIGHALLMQQAADAIDALVAEAKRLSIVDDAYAIMRAQAEAAEAKLTALEAQRRPQPITTVSGSSMTGLEAVGRNALSQAPPSQGVEKPETPMDEFRRRLKRHTGEAATEATAGYDGLRLIHDGFRRCRPSRLPPGNA